LGNGGFLAHRNDEGVMINRKSSDLYPHRQSVCRVDDARRLLRTTPAVPVEGKIRTMLEE
jgi:hypothetical protein